MSARPNHYPFLNHALVQRHERATQDKSPDRSVSEMSFKMEPEKTLLTPPTLYIGDDELSEIGSHKSTVQEQALSSPTSHLSDGASDSGNTPSFHSIKDDDSENTDDKGRREASSALSNNNALDPEVVIDPICAGETDGGCTLRSGDHRKVVSHIFGRNKRCTHQIPQDCWIKYCRKHYQRQKYRCPQDWYETQLQLIDGQINKMEEWGGITSWTIAIRKKERDVIDKENSYLAQHGELPAETCRERFLLPYLGSNKTFKDVRNLVNVINEECEKNIKPNEQPKLPSFELLPDIDERRNPRPKRGGARRITTHGAARPSTPSTFKLSNDPSTGQLTKTDTSDSRTTSIVSTGTAGTGPRLSANGDNKRAASMAASSTSGPGSRSFVNVAKRIISESDAGGDTTEDEHAHKDKRRRRAKSL